MPLYMFYPRRADGVSFSFEAKQLDDDEHAAHYADQLARDHVSSSEIEVWEGERLVRCIDRSGRASPSPDLAST